MQDFFCIIFFFWTNLRKRFRWVKIWLFKYVQCFYFLRLQLKLSNGLSIYRWFFMRKVLIVNASKGLEIRQKYYSSFSDKICFFFNVDISLNAKTQSRSRCWIVFTRNIRKIMEFLLISEGNTDCKRVKVVAFPANGTDYSD